MNCGADIHKLHVLSKFLWGVVGVVNLVEGNGERCLKSGGGGRGVINESLVKQHKRGLGKGRNCLLGGLEGVTVPAPTEILIVR